MPDIAMCSGAGCPIKESCYRHTAEPDSRQTYFMRPPGKDGDCGYYMAAWPKDVPTEPEKRKKPEKR